MEKKKTTKLQIEKGNHQIIYNMFYQCLSSFSTKSFRKRFFEECEVPTILLEKNTYIYILNQWGQLLRNLVIRAFSMQKITTIQPSMFGQTWKQFQCISMTNRHTKKKKTVTWWELALVPRFRTRKQIEKGQNLEDATKKQWSGLGIIVWSQ